VAFHRAGVGQLWTKWCLCGVLQELMSRELEDEKVSNGSRDISLTYNFNRIEMKKKIPNYIITKRKNGVDIHLSNDAYSHLHNELKSQRILS